MKREERKLRWAIVGRISDTLDKLRNCEAVWLLHHTEGFASELELIKNEYFNKGYLQALEEMKSIVDGRIDMSKNRE